MTSTTSKPPRPSSASPSGKPDSGKAKSDKAKGGEKPRDPNKTGRAGRDRNVPGLPARAVAAEAFAQTLVSGRALGDTLEPLASAARLDEADAGLARAIATTAFRHFGSLRAAIAQRLATELPAKAGPLEAILVTAAAQIVDLDVPDHAAVDLAVRLTRHDNRSAPYGGLVNAVLRRIAREADEIRSSRDPVSDMPDWLMQRWRQAYGADIAAAMAAAQGEPAAIDLPARADGARWADELAAHLLPTGSLRLSTREPVSHLPGYEEGAWWVQDAAAAIPARLLRAQPGERVLDLCAAPGGKTAQLAATGAKVTALDRSDKRMARLVANIERLKLDVTPVVADASIWKAEPFDAVLLDAPCSATGTIRRHPEVAWTKSPADIMKLTAMQARLLAHAATLVRPGGRLVYCTCSLEPEEGEEQVAAFLARHRDFRRAPVTPDEVPGLEMAITPQCDLRTRPDMSPAPDPVPPGLDGFYAARLMRA
jgi:16S rRNA (cytosine967-C5)-methyltransferase